MHCMCAPFFRLLCLVCYCPHSCAPILSKAVYFCTNIYKLWFYILTQLCYCPRSWLFTQLLFGQWCSSLLSCAPILAAVLLFKLLWPYSPSCDIIHTAVVLLIQLCSYPHSCAPISAAVVLSTQLCSYSNSYDSIHAAVLLSTQLYYYSRCSFSSS